MRILLSTELFWPYIGGVERLGQKLVAALASEGADIKVVTSHDTMSLPDEDSMEGVPVRRFPFRQTLRNRNPRQLLKVRGELSRLIEQFDPDLVHIYSIGGYLLFFQPFLRKTDLPVFTTIHGDARADPATVDQSILVSTLRHSAWTAACSRSALNSVIQLAPEIESRSSVIRNAFDLDGFCPGEIPAGPPRLLCLSRLVREKGIDTAILAMTRIRQRFPRARLTIAGVGPDRPRLEALVDSEGLRDCVEFPGAVPPGDVPALLDGSTALLIPSLSEGLPIAAIEASLAGRPIVATAVGGLGEIVKDERTGLLVPPGNRAAFTDAVERLLGRPDLAARMGQAARAHAETKFGLSRYVDAYKALYEEYARS